MMHVWKRGCVDNLIATLVYLFFKILGLVPFTMKVTNHRSDHVKIFWYSHVGLVYNGILSVVVFVLSFSSIRAIHSSDFLYKTQTVETIGVIKSVAGTIVLLIIWMYICLKQRTAVKIANRISDIDTAMTRLKHIYEPESSSLRVTLIVAANLFIWVNLIWMDIVGFEVLFASTFVTTVLPSFVFNWFLIQYSFVLIALEKRFRAINQGISRLSKANCSLVSMDRSLLRNLLDIKTSHEILYDVCCEVTDLYSLPVLLIITALCGALLNTAYYLIMPFLLDTEDVSLLNTLDSLAYLAMEMFPIIILSTSVSRVTGEMKLTAGVVHKLLSQFISDRPLKSELKIFSLELLHRQVQFTGCGIFPLDCTLLHSIANMTATYLIILIQFQTNDQADSRAVTSDRLIEQVSNVSCVVNNTRTKCEL